MMHFLNRLRRLGPAVFLLVAFSSLAFSQLRTTGEIRGNVEDPSGAAVPGAQVTLTDEGTGSTVTSSTAADGGFVFAALSSGAYRVSITAPGFQPITYNGVLVSTARSTDLRVQLAVGAVEETIEVTADLPALETSSSTVSTTVNNESIQNLPLAGRDILRFALLVPGAQMGGTDRQSSFNNLPNASLNITLDGVNNNSQRFKSGGTSFFVFAPLRLGAIEEVTVNTTGMGAEGGGQGAMEVKFVTKRGSNEFHGAGFWQHQNDNLNANDFFRNARGQEKNQLILNEFGGSLGGPIIRNRLFFFFNYEQLDRPGQNNGSFTYLTPEAQAGTFRYVGTDNVERTANLLDLAGAAGFQNTVNPLVQAEMSLINSSLGAGVVSGVNPYQNELSWNRDAGLIERYPASRVDYHVTPNVMWSGTWNLRWRDIAGTQQLPCGSCPLESNFVSTYYIASSSVNWTISPTIFNEFKFGVQGNIEQFNTSEDPSQFLVGNELRRIARPLGLTTVVRDGVASPRNNPVWQLANNLSWVKDKHNYTFGGTYRYTQSWERANFGGNGIPQLTLGVVGQDPISSVLTQSALPGVRTADIPNALGLYGYLTGRLTAISGINAVNPETLAYEPFIPTDRREAQEVGGAYFQDSWRMTQNFTLNYGFRLEFSGPTHNTNNIYTNPDVANLLGPSAQPFTPGVLDGVQNPVLFLQPRPSQADLFNPAPNVGFAWNPGFDRQLVIRGHYAVNFYDEGILSFTSFPGNNPGLTQSFFSNAGFTGFEPGTRTLGGPLPPLNTFPQSFSAPFPQSLFTFNSGFNTYDRELRTPYVQNWSLGIQREVAEGTVLEARYVGNKATRVWRAYNLNEVNIFENGFLDEFKNAQKNLAINEANGRTGFANNGLPGQVPLGIFSTAFGPRGSAGALGASQGFANGNFINDLRQGEAGRLANRLGSSPAYLCRLVGSNLAPCVAQGFSATGPFPINIFQANPFAAGQDTRVVDDVSTSNYHALQVELRRTFRRGLSINANYTLSHSMADLSVVSSTGTSDYTTLRDAKQSRGLAPFDLRHVFQAYGSYDLPFSSNNGVLNRVIGGWTISGVLRYQSGRLFRLSSGRQVFNTEENGIVTSMTADQLQDLVRISPGPNNNILFLDPSLIGSDGRADPSKLAPVTTPGVMGQFIDLTGPRFFMPDLALLKEIPVTERVNMNLWFQFVNAFNHPTFLVGGSGSPGDNHSITGNTFGQTSTLGSNPRNIQVRLNIQF